MALSEAGCRVSALYPARGHPLSKTGAVESRYTYRGWNPVASVQHAIEETAPDLVIPCDDRAVGHLHELHTAAAGLGARGAGIRTLIERSLGPPSSYPTTSSRYEFLNIAREEGIRTPRHRAVRLRDDLAFWQAEEPLPWVLKSDGTWGGHGVKIAHTAEQARSFFAAMARPLGAARLLKRLVVERDPFWLRPFRERRIPTVTVQSYVSGRPANCAAVAWEGELLGCISVEVVSAQGDTGSAVVVRVVDSPEMFQAAERLANRLGLSGFFGLDFMIDDNTGACYLIEINPRCTPLSHFRLGQGRDLVGALWAKLACEPYEPKPAITDNELIAYFPQAWHWDPASELLRSSFHDIPSEDPALVEELLEIPWPDRGIVARLFNRLRHTTFADRYARGGMFEAAISDRVPCKEGRAQE